MPQAHESQRTEADQAQVAQTESRVLATLTTRRVDELRPHPAYALLGLKVPTNRLGELIEQGEDAFLAPLTVTPAGTIIDGYARWEVARLQKRSTVECIEYDLSEPEALHRLLLCHRPSPGFVAYNRILLALRLENHFRQRARQNQHAGGKNKGLSKLTEAERANVRKQMADAAGVSVGTLHHAIQLRQTADAAVRQALQDGEIKIHRAWKWSKESLDVQKELLAAFHRNRGMARVAKKLVANHSKRCSCTRLQLCPRRNARAEDAVSRLSSLTPDLLSSVMVIFIKGPGRILALSQDIAQELGFQEEPPHDARRPDQTDPY